MVKVEFEAQLKKWGNSKGILVPKKYADLFDEGLINVHLAAKKDSFKELYGILEGENIDLDKLMREIDEELWDE